MRRARASLVLVLLVLVFALLTTYCFGRWFSHDRYWLGTIDKVQVTQANLIRSMVLKSDNAADWSKDDLREVFAPVAGKIIVEVKEADAIIFSNDNHRFLRGEIIEEISLPNQKTIAVYRYSPPGWNGVFKRWLASPSRWFEPSLDFVTFPFLFFILVYGVGMVAVGFAIKARHLENDVLPVLRDIHRKVSR